MYNIKQYNVECTIVAYKQTYNIKPVGKLKGEDSFIHYFDYLVVINKAKIQFIFISTSIYRV